MKLRCHGQRWTPFNTWGFINTYAGVPLRYPERAVLGPNPAKHPLTIVSECAARPKSLIASADLSINIRRLSLGNQILALVEQLSSAMIGMHSLAATAC
jgi:hypothetical protein